MKTLMHITRLSFILILLASLNACKKSDDNNPDANGNGSGSYTYLGTTTTTTRGDYLQADGNTYIYVYGKEVTDIVQVIFTKVASITEGTFTYHTVSNGYDPAKNFSGGSVTTAAHPEGTLITGGTIKVTKAANGYAVSFDCTTASGSLKGSYTGAFTSR